jgi:LacI family repressor for deo operon, udp, cdd, tsx, nupC, and nupG
VLNHKNNVNLATAQKVEEVIAQLGFSRDARGDARIILLHVPDITNIFYTKVIEGVRSACNANGYQLLIDQTELSPDNERDFTALLQQIHVYGVITLKQLPTALLRRLSRVTRIVQCNEFNPEVDLSYVAIDDFSSSKLATEQLLIRGYTHPCLLNGPRSFRYSRERERGYLTMLAEHDIEANVDWNISLPAVKYEIALPVVTQLLSLQHHPDAFFCVSDTLAAAVIVVAHKLKLRIPQDVAVIGFDNTLISKTLTPALSTISQPRFQLGYAAVGLFKDYADGPRQLILDTELTLRQSL